MDLLGSILKKMAPPPPIMDEKQRKLRQKQQELMKKQREAEQKRIQDFRAEVKDKIDKFDKDENEGPRLKFSTMDKTKRAVIHDISEQHGLVAISFGEEEVDKHVIVFRQHTVPSEPEIMAMKRNEVYIPPPENQDEEDVVGEPAYGQQRTQPNINNNNNSSSSESVPKKNRTRAQPEYLQKYQKHLGGSLKVAKAAAISTDQQRSYGFVSSDLKKDKRTIEETLAEIRARKKQKIENTINESNSQREQD